MGWAPLPTSGPRSPGSRLGYGRANCASRSSRVWTPYEATAPDNCTSQDPPRPSARGSKPRPPLTHYNSQKSSRPGRRTSRRWASDNYTSQDPPRPQRVVGGRLPFTHNSQNAHAQRAETAVRRRPLFHPPGPRYASGGGKKAPIHTLKNPGPPTPTAPETETSGLRRLHFPGHIVASARVENWFLVPYKNSQKAPRWSLWRPQGPLSSSNYNSQNALGPPPSKTKRSTLRQLQLPECSAASAS